MNTLRNIILFLVTLVCVMPAHAITTEQEQQFTYYWYAARQAVEEENFPKALVLLEFCHAIKPNDGQTLGYLGIIYNGLGKKELALDTYRQAFEADPRDQWYRYTNALKELHTEEGEREALKVMEKALKLNPKDEDLLEMLAKQYGVDKQWKKALSMQDRLDAIRGYNFFSALNRFRVYVYCNKPKKALEAIDKYLEQDPTNIQFMLFRVELLETTKAKTADLYAAYEQVLAVQPGHLGILNNYAYHLATHKGDLLKAERMSQITIREEPNNPVYLDTYGWILHLKGQDDLAKFYLNRALWNASEGATQTEIQKHLDAIK